VPRVTLLQTNLTAGELSPRVYGRVDIDRYPNGAKRIENAIVSVQGGARRRPGLRYRAATKTSSQRSRLIPFVFSRTQAYALEFGNNYMRVYRDGAQIAGPYEIATPYTEAMLPAIDYEQDADSMFITHPDVPVQRLQRFADNLWVLAAAPWVTEPYDEIGHRFAGVTLTLSLATVGTGRTATASASAFLAGDVGRTIAYQGGLATITAFTSATVVTVTITVAFAGTVQPAGLWDLQGSPQTTVTPSASTPVGGACNLTATVDTFRASDVGRFVQINGGLVLITGFTTAQNVAGTIRQVLTSTVAAPANAWVLNGAVWSATRGYPRTVTFHEQRLILAGSNTYPQTVWGTKTGEVLNFEQGTEDDDGFAFTLASGEVNPIAYVSSGRALLAMTYGGEFTLEGGVEKPITPTNVRVRQRSNHGCALVRPLTVRRETLFVQRAGRKVRALAYTVANDEFEAPDMTVLSEHITAPSITEMAWQQEPDAIVWAVRSDGVLVAATFDRDQQVTAWVRQITDGFVESVCSVPTATADLTYAIVRRTVNGSTVRYVETVEAVDFTYPTGELVEITLDSYISGTSGPGTDTWTGLGHLEGKSVQCVADGSYMGTFTVASGSITLPRAAFSVVIGLGFVYLVEPLAPELQTGTGSAQGNSMRTHEISLRLLDTVGGTVNGQEIPTRRLGPGVLGSPPIVTSGLVRLNANLGWERGESELLITQPLPLPFHLLQIIRKLTVND
jgi:hypothetical protein